MAKIHGRKAAFYCVDAGGTERNLSNYLNNIDFPDVVDTAEVSAFGDTDKAFVIGLKTRTIKGQGFWDAVANGPDETLSGLLGGGASGTIQSVYKFAPQGSASGNVYYTGTMILTNYQRTAPIGGAVTFSFDAQANGAGTRTTF